MRVAKVVIFNKYADLDGTLDYRIPPHVNAPVGAIVKVPLQARVVEGIVFAHSEDTAVAELRDIIAAGPCLPRELVELADWLAVRAGCSVAAAVTAMLPPRFHGNPPVRWRVDEKALAVAELTEKQRQAADFLRRRRPMLKAELSRALGISKGVIDKLVEKGVLIPAVADDPWDLEEVVALTAAQQAAISSIEAKTNGLRQGGEFLLYGVTGSGKTQVYINLARKVLQAGRQALVLVPEIALTSQLVARFRMEFGAADIVLLHSGLSASVRAEDWQKIVRGQASIVIGTRSAVFAPLSNLGLIVVDEEHEPAYKQEEVPRYHARDVALFRARWHKGILVLGSATPSLESYTRAMRGRYHLIAMPQRVSGHTPVTAEIVDMRAELRQGNRDIFSRALRQALEETLARNEQALLFLNRRGVAPTVLCRNCGFKYSCPNCSTALTLHGDGKLLCHHCGARALLAQNCPQCGSKYLCQLGLGTEKLEARLKEIFPHTAVCRLDRDTAASAADKERYLSGFYRQESGILLGTQMIAKGLDFPRVTLVGIVLADLSLGMPDFRAGERTFQLITQAAGRTGRSKRNGRVIVQTYQPEHYSIRFALDGDYEGFYRYELRQRKAAGMPPFSALTRILVSSPEQENLLAHVRRINDLLAGSNLELLYSGPPPLEKLKGRYRWHYLFRHSGSRADWLAVHALHREISTDRQCRVVIDNNPYNFM